MTPLELFSLFYTDEVWDLLVAETNHYAGENFSTSCHARKWKNVTVQQMKAFVGILIMMGILQLPQLEMYWEQDDDILCTPGISALIGRVKFEQILRFLHLANNSHQQPWICQTIQSTDIYYTDH